MSSRWLFARSATSVDRRVQPSSNSIVMVILERDWKCKVDLHRTNIGVKLIYRGFNIGEILVLCWPLYASHHGSHIQLLLAILYQYKQELFWTDVSENAGFNILVK